MKSTPRLLFPCRLLAVAAGACAWNAAAQPSVPSAPVLSIRPVVEISMPTEAGKVYQMQTSTDLQSWENHGDPIFGTGTPLHQPMAGGPSQFFRLQVLTTPAIGDAPWKLENTSTQFNESIRTVRYDFLPDGQGTTQAGNVTKTFTWTWLRHGPAAGKAELTLPDDTREVLEMNYTAGGLGRFTRQTFTGTRLDNSDSGTFGPTPVNPAPAGSWVPASITGRPIALCEIPTGGGLTLTNATTGTRLLDGTRFAFTGSWLVTGTTTARLTASFGPAHGEDYRFTFTGPLAGRYTRQTFTEGIFRDEDEGTFCMAPPP